VDGSTVKMAISTDFDMVTEMLKDMETNFLTMFGDDQSFDFSASMLWAKSIKQILNGTVS